MLYFAKAENFVKIGHSENPQRRIRELQVSCPLPISLEAVMPGDKYLEDALHRLFKAHKIHGEWFTLSQPIIDYMKKYAFPEHSMKTWKTGKY